MAQSQKKLSKLAKRNEKARFDIEKLQEEEVDDGQTIQDEAQNEVEFELET